MEKKENEREKVNHIPQSQHMERLYPENEFRTGNQRRPILPFLKRGRRNGRPRYQRIKNLTLERKIGGIGTSFLSLIIHTATI